MKLFARTAAASIAVGFVFGFLHTAMYGGFFMWFIVYFIGFAVGKFLHKMAGHKMGGKVIATIIGGILIGLFLSPGRDVMLGKTPAFDEQMEEAIIANSTLTAQKTLPDFEKAMAAEKKPVGYSGRALFMDGNTSEHLWFRVTKDDGDKFVGILSQPERLKNYQEGDKVVVNKKDLEDWIYYDDEHQKVGGYSIVPTDTSRSFNRYWSETAIWINILVFVAGAISPIFAVRIKN